MEIFYLLLFLATSSTIELVQSVEIAWDYELKGPHKWSEFYSFCGGRKQSPIDLNSNSSIYDPTIIMYRYEFTTTSNYKLKIENDGHKVVAHFPQPSPLKLGLLGVEGTFYTAAQMHWHWGSDDKQGSEHSINGKYYPLELHVVFWNHRDYRNFSEAAGKIEGLAVVGFLYNMSSTFNDPLIRFFEPTLRNMSKTSNASAEFEVNSSKDDLMLKMLPNNTKSFYRYEGSLTTPSCSENVLWTVYATPLPVSESQLLLLRSFKNHDGSQMVNNNRPTQQLNFENRPGVKRFVYKTFKFSARHQASFYTLITCLSFIILSLCY